MNTTGLIALQSNEELCMCSSGTEQGLISISVISNSENEQWEIMQLDNGGWTIKDYTGLYIAAEEGLEYAFLSSEHFEWFAEIESDTYVFTDSSGKTLSYAADSSDELAIKEDPTKAEKKWTFNTIVKN